MNGPTEEQRAQSACDEVASSLQQLRSKSGGVPYAEIVTRIGQRRITIDPRALAPARSTVYDAFRTGRVRINAALVREIAEALDADPDDLSELERQCARVHPPSPAPARRPRDSETLPDATHPAPPVMPQRPRSPSALTIVLVLLAAVGVNTAGHAVVAWLGLPLYLDMVGTAIAAFALGPWWAVAVAILTNTAGVLVNSEAALPFALVNAAGALVWGYGARRLGGGQTLLRFFVLNVAVAITCTLVAVPILLLVFSGTGGHAADDLTFTFEGLGESALLAVVSSNLITSLADKLIAGFLALVVITALTPRLRLDYSGISTMTASPIPETPRTSSARTAINDTST